MSKRFLNIPAPLIPGSSNIQSLQVTTSKVVGILDMASNKIENLGEPLANQDAATKLYVDTNGGGGDVVGPGVATDNAIVRYNGTDGKLIQNSGVIIDDSDNITTVLGTITGGTVTGGTLTDGSFSVNSGAVTGATTITASGSIQSNTGIILRDDGILTVTIEAPPSLSSDYTLTLPVDAGTSTQVLSTDGTGVLSWAASGGSPAGPDGALQFNNSGSFGGDSFFVYDNVAKSLDSTTSMTLNATTNMALNATTNMALNATTNMALFSVGSMDISSTQGINITTGPGGNIGLTAGPGADVTINSINSNVNVANVAFKDGGLTLVKATGIEVGTVVTVNSKQGIITTSSLTLTTGSIYTFTVTCDESLVGSAVISNVISYGGAAGGLPIVTVNNVTGSSFDIQVGNSGTTTLDAPADIFFMIV
jgi:hypothetical protein